MPKTTVNISNMTCASCASTVERFLNKQDGVDRASVNFANHTAHIAYSDTTIETLRGALQGIGYDMLLVDTEQKRENIEQTKNENYLKLKKKTFFAFLFALPLFIIGMFFMDMPYGNYILWVLASPMVFYFGKSFFVGAYKQLKIPSANMDTLVALSTGTAYLFSVFSTLFPSFWHSRGLHAHVYFEAAGIVIAFVLLGKLLEEKAKSSTHSAIKKLMGLQPKTVYIVDETQQQREISINEIKENDRVLVRAGERIAVDGKVIQGESYVDESSISGEALPVWKTLGSSVLSGTINQKGLLHIRAEKVGKNTLLSTIIQHVEEAQASKAPIQKTIDKIAAIFVPVVLLIAVLSCILWIIFGGKYGLEQGILSAITVLVIACPCALGLATPTAIMVGIGKAAQKGVLIKDAQSIEQIRKIKKIVFDKTGTITEGKHRIVDMEWCKEKSFQSVLYSIERSSDHPLAESIARYLEPTSDFIPTISVETIRGQGLQAIYQGEHFFVGNLSLIKQQHVPISSYHQSWINRHQEDAHTVVLFAKKDMLLALIALSDTIKTHSIEAIQSLKKNGIEPVMLTGDNEHVAKKTALDVGISNYQANMLPIQKAEKIKELQQNKTIIAMVGDGINDSNALAQADVSIAMGKGSDIAMDVASMTIVSSDLSKIQQAIRISKQTSVAIYQNLFWAFIYNIIGIPIAAGLLIPINGFHLDPMWAGAAMALSSVSVVVNSLRIALKK